MWFHECGEDEDSTRTPWTLLNVITFLAQSQQITPDIRFTCESDGMITEWMQAFLSYKCGEISEMMYIKR